MIPGVTTYQGLAPRVGSLALPPAGEGLLETVTIDNFSGAARTDPYITFARDFEAGDVPSNARVELRYSGTAITLQQADGRVYHPDGSLRRAIFSCKPASGSVADNGTLDVALWRVDGAFGNTSSILRSTLTAQDYKVRVRIAGVDYFCLLNNCDTAGAYRQIRVGNTVRAFKHWGVLRNGQGGSDTDHGQLQARFYSYVWSDGTITTWADVSNGRVANGQAYTVDEIELLNGASSLQSYTADFTFYHHTCCTLVGADGLPIWSANPTYFQPRVTSLYLHERKLEFHIYSTATQRSAIGNGTALTYAPNVQGNIDNIDQAGGSPWIGVFPQWSVLAYLSNNKTRWQNDRINALAQNVKHPGWYIRTESGEPPVLTNTDYTGAGLTASQTNVGWNVAATISSTGGDISGAVLNWSHRPNYAGLQWFVTGWEWWCDRVVQQVIGSLGSDNPGNDTYARNPTINSATYYGAAANRDTSREHGWAIHTVGSIAWTIPDDHICAAYIREINTTTLAVVAEKMSGPYTQYSNWNLASADAMGIYTGDEASANGIAVAPWMQNYRALAIMQQYHRGYISASHKAMLHVERWIVGMLVACPYQAVNFDRVAYRQGSQPTNSAALVTDFSQVWGGGDGGSPSQATAATIKLISDAGGTSGTCPTSGANESIEPYAAGHTRPSIYHAVAEVAHGLGITGATAGRDYLVTLEASKSLSESAWNDNPQWRIRWPA